LHVEELEVVLLVGDNDVDVALAGQAVVHGAEKTIPVRRKVDPDDFGGLVGDDVEESGVLVGEAVVVLTPYGAGKEDVQAGYFYAPVYFVALLEPLAVLADLCICR